MTKSEMTALLENEYIPKILGFSYQKVNTPADAEDLASDIVFEVIKSVNSGRPIDNMNAFVWSVSNHTFCKWLRSKRCGTTTCLPDMPMSCDDVEEIYIKTEKIALLHREISLLAREYRHCVVLYYFEEKNCADIAKILGKSVGTIKWWLHEARKSLKEGMNIMRDYGEKSYRPETLFLSCQGNPGGDNEPMSCTKRILPQNILLAAYKEPLTVKQLCIELGASAPYIEDEIEHLVKNQLMKAVSGGRTAANGSHWDMKTERTGMIIKAINAGKSMFPLTVLFINSTKVLCKVFFIIGADRTALYFSTFRMKYLFCAVK